MPLPDSNSASPTPMVFSTSQKAVAQSLGVSESHQAMIRAQLLVQGRDWILKNGRVLYSEAGLEQLRALVGAQPPPTPDKVRPEATGSTPVASSPALADIKTPGPNEDGPHVELLIVHRASAQGIVNIHIIEGYRPGADHNDRAQIKRIRVKNNTLFIPGMEVPVRHLQADYYECTRGVPRERGRW